MAKTYFFLLIILLALGFCQIGAEQKDVPQNLPSPPLITSVLPTSVYLNSPPFLLYVYGENFTGDSVILINKLACPTTFISEKELRCSAEMDFDAITDDTLPRLRGNFSRGGQTKKMTVVVKNPGIKSSNSMTIRLLDKGFINFTKPYPIITHPSSSYFFEDIETDNQGNIYIVYEYPFPGSDVDELYLVHSSNYGKTWESPINISNTPLLYPKFLDLVVDKDGNLLLVWSESPTPWTSGHCVYFSRSTNQGLTWENPKQLLKDLFFCENLGILVEAGGEIDVIAYVYENNISSIYFFRSLDKGQTWTQNQIATVRYIISSFPLALDEKGNLHTAFDRVFTVDGGLVDYLYYSKSSDHGLTWQNSFISSTGMGTIKIAVNKLEGSVYLVWNYSNNYRPNIRETYFCRSLTNGDSWDIPIQLNKTVYPTYTANFDTVVDSKGNFYILVGGLNIFLLRLPAGKDTWNPPIFIGKRDIIYTPLKITCDDQDTLYLIWNDNRSLYFSKSGRIFCIN